MELFSATSLYGLTDAFLLLCCIAKCNISTATMWLKVGNGDYLPIKCIGLAKNDVTLLCDEVTHGH